MPVVPVAGGPKVDLGITPNVRESLPGVDAPDVQLRTPQLDLPGYSAPKLNTPRFAAVTKDPNAIRHIQMSDRGASEMQQMGRDLASTGSELGDAAMRMQVKVNATVVDDALNDAREQARVLTWGKPDGKGGMVGGYKNAKGYDAIKRDSGKGLDDEVGDEFDSQVREIAKNKLNNADQRQAFSMQVNDLAAQLKQGATAHASEQFDAYHSEVYKGMVQNLTQDFALRDPTDLAGQKEAMTQIEGAVATLAQHQGASAQELDVAQRASRGAAVASMFDSVMAEKKYGVAQALLNEWGKKIDANTATRMKLSLDGRVSVQVGEQLADEAWRSWAAPAFSAQDPDKAFNVVIGLETKGKHVGDNGKVTTSPKGAFGIAQLMPDTAKAVAKKLGHPELADLAKQPTKQGEAANRLLGKVHFNDLVTQFNGDIPKAMAAYNAGTGWLIGGKDSKGNKIEGALKEAATKGGDWRDYLPQETKDYVANGMKAFGAGEGVPPKPKKLDLYAAVDKRTDDPDVRRAAYSRIDRNFSAAEADESNGYESSYAEGLRITRETGGNINAIPPELKAKIKPEQYTAIQGYAKNLADGQYIHTKPEAYYTAMVAAMDPRTTLNQFEAMRPDLSEQDFKTAQSIFLERRAPQPGKGPDSLDVSSLDSLVKTRLQYLGVEVSPKKGDKQAEARLGAITQFTHQYVLDLQRQKGSKIEDYGDMEKAVNQLFTRNQDFRNTIMGIPGTGSHGQMNVMTAEVKDIPGDTRKRLSDALEKKLGRKPQDAEVLQSYFRSQFYTGASNGR